MTDKRNILIPATEGGVCVVRQGETIRKVDVEGQQICDFVCFHLHHLKEKLSPGETVNFNMLIGSGSMHFTVSSKFYSNLQHAMSEIVEEQANGVHDALFAPCSSAVYVAAETVNHRNC